MSNLIFTSWVRRGVAGAITEPDPVSGPWLGPATFKPSLTIMKNGGDSTTITAPTDLSVLGPGAVIGLNRKMILRTDPTDGARGVEENYLTQIEFARADLPWMFTPAAPGAKNRLRPWLVLVVVNAAATQVQPGTPLPSISVNDSELPDLNDSWAWAHAQITVDDAAKAEEELIPATGTSAISRLLCPRRLQADTTYLACVVPATRQGAQAGLGMPLDQDPVIHQAWVVGAGQDVLLPVYYSWQFTTGDGGDFKSLVQLLKGVASNEVTGFGLRTVDVSSPWLKQEGPPPAPGTTTFSLGGALHFGADDPGADPLSPDFTDRLTKVLNFPGDLKTANATPQDSASAVAPPIYAGRHAGVDHFPAQLPGWLQTLNLEPRHRIAASFGTTWVQENQEFLMAQAWNQLGAVQDANRLHALAELSMNRFSARAISARPSSRSVTSLSSKAVSEMYPAFLPSNRSRLIVPPAAS